MSGCTPVVREFCDLRSFTSLDLFPYVYNRRLGWVVSYFTDSKMYGLWVVPVVFHTLISLNLECI